MTQEPVILKIHSAEAFPVRLNFGMGVSHSITTRNFTDNVMVKITSVSGISGLGECVPREYVTGETVKGVIAALNGMLVNLGGASFDSASSVIGFLRSQAETSEGKSNHSALCAMELALLDLAGKTWHNTLSDLTGVEIKRQSLVYSLVVPLMKDKKLFRFLEKASAFEFSQVKIKVDAVEPVSQVEKVRSILGKTVELRVDANCAWNRENAPGFMKALAELGVVSVEQPLHPGDIEGSAGLNKLGLMHVTLDESAFSVDDIREIAEKKAADVINIRISKCGGILESQRIIEESRKHGLLYQLGAHVGESCILTAAGAFLASCTPDFLWIEGCFGSHLLSDSICIKPLQFGKGGSFRFTGGHGLGLEIDPALLTRAAETYKKF